MSGRGKRMCAVCSTAPAAFPGVDTCFKCWPSGPVTPPPCYRCGSKHHYFVGGLCHKCHRDGHPGVDSCMNCLAWGATRTYGWLCQGCNSWCRKFPDTAACAICSRASHLDEHNVCRLCRKQGAYWRQRGETLDLVAANKHGQQLFFADMFRQRDKTQPDLETAQPPEDPPIRFSAAHQLMLFDIHRDLADRDYRLAGLAARADRGLFAQYEPIIRERARQFGWSKSLSWQVRTGVQVVLALQSSPGAPVNASEAAVLGPTDLPLKHVLEVFDAAGMLVDDREPAFDQWFARQTADLPEQMRGELSQWFTTMRHGRTQSPRRRPRSTITIGLYLRWAMPALTTWASAGKNSLREITTADIRDALPGSGDARITQGRGLRSVFGILRAQKVIFINPMHPVKTGYLRQGTPLPVDPARIRQGLSSPDPGQASIVALAAFHGVRPLHLRELKLTDISGGYMHIGDRRILLAAPVRSRLAAWLTYRSRTYPNTANTHLFVTQRSATGAGPVGYRWIKLRADIVPGGVQAIREDRILHEAHATGGDVRRICDFFGMSVQAASRYARTVDHPDLIQAAHDLPTHGDGHHRSSSGT
jgi:hypothetical protein